MWRKQPEAKPSSSAPNNFGTPAHAASAPSFASPANLPNAQSASAPAKAPNPLHAAVLTRGIRIKGELAGKADLYIDGEVEGKICLAESSVAIGPEGRVNANIDAREIVVRGKVNGNLRGRERVSLGATSAVKGDLESPRVAIEDGARFKGRVEMGPAADARERIVKRAPTGAPLGNSVESASSSAKQITNSESSL